MLRSVRLLAAAALAVTSTGVSPMALAQKAAPDFGDDTSQWSRDGECDDKRFTGAGMTTTILLESDIGHDATDCRAAWNAGKLQLAKAAAKSTLKPNFGDDDSEFAEDGQCDDPRFTGLGMADDPFAEDILHDASDCRKAWNKGELRLIGIAADGSPRFGDDDGDFALDVECDDPRFEGKGMSETEALADDIMHDASDCRAAWNAGDLKLR